MYMRIPELNLNFKDSLCFLPMAMRQFPGTFGLTVEKGYFPHFFNGPENQNYRGPLPPLETYGYRSMAPKPAQELKEWYDEEVRRGRVFDFETDLLKYCRQDVLVLMRGVLKARQLFYQTDGVDPFTECFTIASSCMRSFRKNFLEPDTIGIIPQMGYRRGDVQSVKALKWLCHVEKESGIGLRTALSPEGEADHPAS